MKRFDILIHLLGALVLVSAVYHSRDQLLAMVMIVPYALLLAGSRFGIRDLELGGLMGVTFLAAYLLEPCSMDDITLLLFFTITFVVPFIFYWGLVLTDLMMVDLSSTVFAILYFFLTLLFFYFLILFMGVGEYLLSIGNNAPQALILTASALLVFVPFHLVVKRDEFTGEQ